MRFKQYINEGLPDSGDKIELLQDTKAKEGTAKKGMYDVVELWEKGILIKNNNGRYFIPRDSNYKMK